MALAISAGRRVGLLTHRPASGVGADLATGLLRVGLPGHVYATRHDPQLHAGHGVVQHARQALKTPLRYLGALGRAVTCGQAQALRAALDIAAQGRRDGVTHLHACDEASNDVAAWAAGFLGIGFSFWLPARFPPAAHAASLACRLRTASLALGASETAVRAAATLAPRAALRCAYPGVDYRHFSPRLRRPAPRVPLILAVAATGEREGVELVIEACRRLVKQGLELRCDIVCDRDNVAGAMARVDRGELQHAVRVLGPVSPSQLEDRLARATLYVQVPPSDDAGLALDIRTELLRAMAMGLPVLAQRSPVHEECISHGDNGWLFAPTDAAALAGALQHLLSTPRLGEQLGKQARERVLEQFDTEVNLRGVKAWLEQAAFREEVRRRRAALLWQRAEKVHHA